METLYGSGHAGGHGEGLWRDIFRLVEDMDVYMITDKGVDMVKDVEGGLVGYLVGNIRGTVGGGTEV